MKNIIEKAKDLMGHDLSELGLYEKALEEYENGEKNKGLLAKSIAVAGGDESKIKATYLKLKVELLKSEFNQRRSRGELTQDFEKVADAFEIELDKAINPISKVIGFYFVLGLLAIVFFLLAVIFDITEPGFIFILLGGIVLIRELLKDNRIEEFDMEEALDYCFRFVGETAKTWLRLKDKNYSHLIRFQKQIFPEKLSFDGKKFGTADLGLVYKLNQENGDDKSKLVSLLEIEPYCSLPRKAN